jgi:hypothetical protein
VCRVDRDEPLSVEVISESVKIPNLTPDPSPKRGEGRQTKFLSPLSPGEGI